MRTRRAERAERVERPPGAAGAPGRRWRPGNARGAGRRTLGRALLAAIAAIATACGGGSDAPPRRFLSLGTAGTGGIYYPLGGGLASRLSLRDSTRTFTAEVTGGSVENVNRLRAGEMDLAFALPITLWQAYHGGDQFPEPYPGLRAVAPLYPNLSHVLVAAGHPARSLADLRGARIAVGPPGSGTEQVARELLAAYGLTYDDVEERFLSFTEAANALKDRAIDAALLSVGYPASSVLDALTTGGARLLPLDPEVVERLAAERPYFTPGEIPAGAYPGVERPLPTLALVNWVVADASLDDDVVEAVLDVLAEDADALAEIHPMAARIDLGRLDSPPVPLHPAAERWWAAHRGAAAPPD